MAKPSSVLAIAPKLLDNIYCVFFWKNLDPGLYRPREIHLHFYNLLEVRLKEHFMAGDIIIIDFEHFSFGDYVKHTPALLVKFIKIYQVGIAFFLEEDKVSLAAEFGSFRTPQRD